MDERYNNGLFESSGDPLQTHFAVSSQVFLEIVEELYFPKAPYSFAVLDADFLGQVYEVFLSKKLAIQSGNVVLTDKPDYEDREVVTTPQPLVDELVRRAVQGKYGRLREGGEFDIAAILEIRILDIAVGSGRFLIRSLDELVDAAVQALRGDDTKVIRKGDNDYRLSFDVKKALLESCLYGVDIDYNAVEVARFSLVVKLLEDENAGSLPHGRKILPNLNANIVWGNSVVESSEFNATAAIDWEASGLPASFSVIVGNPPYMKTEEMRAKHKDEFDFYKSRYVTAYKQFDKYFIFLEKGISLLSKDGWLGMVVPNKWMHIESATRLRGLLAESNKVCEIVDFGNELIFQGKSTYVCLLVLGEQKATQFNYRHVNDYVEWQRKPSEKGMILLQDLLNSYGGRSWILPADEDEAKVLSVLTASSYLLSDIADVSNGIQTSADSVFAIQAFKRHGKIVKFKKTGKEWEIEAAITKPYLMNSTNIKSFCPIVADALVIFPYFYNANGEAILIPPEILQADFPLAWKYLCANRIRLSERDVSPPPSRGEFYKYGRHQALNSAFQGNKIIYSVNQLGDKYAWDVSGCGFASGGTAGEVAISNPKGGYAMEFILALLNERVSEFFLRKRGSPFRGGYYSRGSAVVKDLPVPIIDFGNRKAKSVHDSIVNLTRQLAALEVKSVGAIGRDCEKYAADKRKLRSKISVEFGKLWDFEGSDDMISLPGG